MLCLLELELKKMDRLNSILPNGSFVCHSPKGVAWDKWVHCLIEKVAIHPYMCSGEFYLFRGGFPVRWLTGQQDQLLRHSAMWRSNWQTTADCICFCFFVFFDQEEAVFSEWVSRKSWYRHLFMWSKGFSIYLLNITENMAWERYFTKEKTWARVSKERRYFPSWPWIELKATHRCY